MIIGISGKIESGKDTVGKIIQYLTLDDEVFAKTNADIIADLEYNEYCANKSDWKIKKFAGKLKQIVSILTGISIEDLEKQEVKNKVLGEEWARWKTKDGNPIENDVSIQEYMTVRQLFQKIGTEAMRDVIHPNVWVNALFVDYKPIREIKENDPEPILKEEYESGMLYPKWIITDMRFSNELEAVKDRGGITIRVNRLRGIGKGRLLHTSEIDYTANHPSETALDNATFDYVIDNNGTIEELIEKVKIILEKEKII